MPAELDALEIRHHPGLAGILHLFLQNLRIADDRVQRRAQLMAHIGQKLRLGLVGALRLVAGFRHLRFHRLAVGDVIAPDDQRRLLVIDHHLPADQAPEGGAVQAPELRLFIAEHALGA